jgi:hypothetical protein
LALVQPRYFIHQFATVADTGDLRELRIERSRAALLDRIFSHARLIKSADLLVDR